MPMSRPFASVLSASSSENVYVSSPVRAFTVTVFIEASTITPSNRFGVLSLHAVEVNTAASARNKIFFIILIFSKKTM